MIPRRCSIHALANIAQQRLTEPAPGRLSLVVGRLPGQSSLTCRQRSQVSVMSDYRKCRICLETGFLQIHRRHRATSPLEPTLGYAPARGSDNSLLFEIEFCDIVASESCSQPPTVSGMRVR